MDIKKTTYIDHSMAKRKTWQSYTYQEHTF